MLTVLRHRNFALLWSAGLISLAGDWILFIALPFYVYSLTHSTLATGGLFVAETLPRLLIGSVAGVFVDRWERKWVMVGADLARGVLMVFLLTVHSTGWVWVVFLVSACESTISQVFNPARSAALPSLVERAELAPANSLDSLSDALTRLAGAPLGGILFGLVGLTGVALVDGVSYLCSGALIALISVSLRAVPAAAIASVPAEAALRRMRREWLEGMRIMRDLPVIGALSAATALSMVGQGIGNVLLVVFVKNNLHGSAALFGGLATVQGAGALLGSVAMGRLAGVLLPRRVLAPSFALVGLSIGALAGFPSVPVALLASLLIGVLAVASVISMRTLLQTIVPNELRGRVFGTRIALNALATTAGMVAAGALGGIFGAIPLLEIAGGFWLSAGVAALLGLRSWREASSGESVRT